MGCLHDETNMKQTYITCHVRLYWNICFMFASLCKHPSTNLVDATSNFTN